MKRAARHVQRRRDQQEAAFYTDQRLKFFTSLLDKNIILLREALFIFKCNSSRTVGVKRMETFKMKRKYI